MVSRAEEERVKLLELKWNIIRSCGQTPALRRLPSSTLRTSSTFTSISSSSSALCSSSSCSVSSAPSSSIAASRSAALFVSRECLAAQDRWSDPHHCRCLFRQHSDLSCFSRCQQTITPLWWGNTTSTSRQGRWPHAWGPRPPTRHPWATTTTRGDLPSTSRRS